MMPVRLVTFDVTGTLLNFRIPIIEKYVETGLKYGVKTDSETLKNEFKKACGILNQEHPNFGRDSGLGWQKWWKAIVEKCFVSQIDPSEQQKAVEIAKDLIEYHTTKEAFTIRPGTEELLRYLKAESCVLGVISNYDPRLHEILQALDLKKYFNFCLTSYEFGHMKPDAKIFQEALTLANCPSANEALHVGDDLEADYLGARKAGWKAALMSSNKKAIEHDEIEKSNVFENFFDLKDYFKKLKNLREQTIEV